MDDQASKPNPLLPALKYLGYCFAIWLGTSTGVFATQMEVNQRIEQLEVKVEQILTKMDKRP